jgi:hypothetical protein
MVEEEILTDQVTLYERGTTSDTFTLILQGKVLIRTGISPQVRMKPQDRFNAQAFPSELCMELKGGGEPYVAIATVESGPQWSYQSCSLAIVGRFRNPV